MEDHEKAELEQIQQEITLTLQEIDQNFARCVQIVSEGIIPEIARYKVASQGVWDGLKVQRLIVFATQKDHSFC